MTDGSKNTTADLLEHCVAIDLELGRDEHIRDIGAVLGCTGLTFRRSGHSAAALDALDSFSESAKLLLGHNVAEFDRQHLAAERPTLRLLHLPVIDTLWLNPLAFPRNPYHHLVKHYKDGALLRDHRNNPVEDARLALELFRQQWQALIETGARDPDRLAAWHWLTTVDDRISGMSQVFAAMRGHGRPSRAHAFEALAHCLAGQCCRNAQRQALDEAETDGWPLAYVLAWLSVATTGNSVMPPWVRHRIPAAASLLHRLRNVGCTDDSCTWCREHHDATRALKHWFNLPAFRPEPKEETTGHPLQQAIVEAAMGGRHVLGILPTGTGKSICYQIPALSRFENTGALTVVVSPLVALMADQVAGLKKHGIESSAAINGLLSPVERKQVLDGVRLGEIGILIVSPEQLRNPGLCRTLAQREIGGWVLDEAHCLSKWGQDFRPDYRYVARFIRKSAGEYPIPPVLCLTATAKPSVVEDIVAHFRNELRIDLAVFNGGARRDNLELLVHRTHPDRKFADVFALIEQELPPDRKGGTIVYCATRKGVEEMAAFLRDKGLAAAHFHSKLPPETKKNVQAKFIDGELRVIAATNAFGMGIDKPDVRLVVHADIPGSLENYLQEAGRAGRDREAARCVLLYTDDDVERQFGMSARSRLAPKEIRAILKSLRNLDGRRRKSQQFGETLVATTGEILMEDEDGEFQRDTATDDTRVKTAVSWLEDAQLLEREENQIQVFPSSLRISSVEEAREKLERSPLPPEYRKQLLAIAEALVNADPDQGISTDELIGLSGLSAAKLHKAFADLEALGIARNDTALTVFVHVGVQGSSHQRLEASIAMETNLLRELRDLAPDFGKGDSSSLQLRLACQRLRDRARECAKERTNAGEQDREPPDVLPDTVRRLLKGIADDGRDEDSETGSLTVSRIDGENVRVTLNREWEPLEIGARLRRQAGRCLLEHLHAVLPPNARGTDLLAETTMGNLLAALDADLVIKAESGTRDLHKLLHRTLLWLHDQEIVRLNKGLMVFRQAMTLRLNTDWKKQFAKSDYEPLSFHYDEQKTQVHVIARYASLGLEIMQEARELAADYFVLPTQSFLQTWLPGREKELQRQTTPQSWARIVEDLRNKSQRDIVADDRENPNVLVLAGPGSGKTRVLVHRIAYLIRVRREPPAGILALAYNRHAAVQIRRRLADLVGDDARGVIVLTLHAFAMRLVGASFAERNPTEKEDGFTAILRDAIALLKGESRSPEDADALRDRLLGGFRWILVDEYQDIGPEQYELVSAIAGRTRAEGEDRPGLFAVGDDDQNIYTFNHTSVDFIRRFEADYGAKPAFLVENFRSTAHIVTASNALIRHHPGRLKAEHPIRVDKAREKAPPGGAWQGRDAIGKGRVQILHAGRDARQQALAVVQELQRLAALDAQWDWSHCAVVARSWHLLGPVRACCEQLGIPVQSADEESLPLWRLRETQALLDWLGERGSRLARAGDMGAWLDEHRDRAADNPWLTQLAAAIADYAADTANEELPVAHFREWLAELGRDLRHRQSGLLLASVHRAKGMEFDHVAVLDGDWDAKKNDTNEQRRLYYVAMTRARETLALCRFDNRPHAFLDALDDGSHLLRRTPVELPPSPAELERQYVFPALREVHLGFAGRHRDGHPVHAAISRLSPGMHLSLVNADGSYYLLHGNERVGRMSDRNFRMPADMQCLTARVRAILVWDKKFSDSKFAEPRCERWEVVVPELVFEPATAR
jgi:ATP-dependent DNA helicase RecQ